MKFRRFGPSTHLADPPAAKAPVDRTVDRIKPRLLWDPKFFDSWVDLQL
jgi:hypothetical protein